MDGKDLDPLTLLLADREIRNLRARYWRLADMQEWEAYGDLFTEDATWHAYAEDWHCEGRQGIVAAVRQTLGSCSTVHHGHMGEVYVEDEDHAHGVWPLEDYLSFAEDSDDELNPWPGATVKGFGHYFDRYERVDGEWKIAAIELYRLRIEQFRVTKHAEGYPAGLRASLPPSQLGEQSAAAGG